jgi:hypothetical protein
MARRYGSSRYSSSCYRFSTYDSYTLAQYACMVVFLAVYLGTLIMFCIVRKKTGAGKRLVGVPYMFALIFMFM